MIKLLLLLILLTRPCYATYCDYLFDSRSEDQILVDNVGQHLVETLPLEHKSVVSIEMLADFDTTIEVNEFNGDFTLLNERVGFSVTLRHYKNEWVVMQLFAPRNVQVYRSIENNIKGLGFGVVELTYPMVESNVYRLDETVIDRRNGKIPDWFLWLK